ncbi:MAG: hypothetical protein AB6733_14960 [Clostridiaceae bacterium]
MKKLRIYCNKEKYGERCKSTFYYFFYKLIEKCNASLWITCEDSFYIPYGRMDDKTEAIVDKEFNEGIIFDRDGNMLVNNEFMLKFAQFIRNDWNRLICYTGDLDCFHKIVDEIEYNQKKYPEGIISFVLQGNQIDGFELKFVLENFDTFYWDLFSLNNEYIDKVKGYLGNDKDIVMKEMEDS